eukprot:XP_020398499.1 atherin-like [Zea mays]
MDSDAGLLQCSAAVLSRFRPARACPGRTFSEDSHTEAFAMISPSPHSPPVPDLSSFFSSYERAEDKNIFSKRFLSHSLTLLAHTHHRRALTTAAPSPTAPLPTVVATAPGRTSPTAAVPSRPRPRRAHRARANAVPLAHRARALAAVPAAAPTVPLTRARRARRARARAAVPLARPRRARAAVPLAVPLACPRRAPRLPSPTPLAVPLARAPHCSPAVPSPARRLARDPSSRPRPNLQGDCLLYVLRV